MPAANNTSPQLAVSVPEAARLLSTTRRTIYNLINDGELKSVKVRDRRLIPYAEVERLAREGTTPA